MRAILCAAAALGIFASLAVSANLPSTHVRGEYIEARTADVYTGPCFANSEVGLAGDLAVMGWKIEQGSFEGVNLDGLAVMGVIRASNTLGDVTNSVYPVQAVVVIDSKANAEQRLALKDFAQKMGGKLLADVVRVEYQPIEFSLAGNSVHSGKAVMHAGNLVKLETRPLTDTDEICHNEAVWYEPLTPVEHAMPAFTVANDYSGQGLGTSWNYSGNRGSFVGTFQVNE
ncbi:MAG TPA: DUF1326 domain-containing protein [Bryobacteraceae bacterium]|nr:DUF1326 domain-containing protein [Bryobacteraceae bacterium]